MASDYKYCRHCGDRKHNRWGLKSVYYCSTCGHRTCREHLNGNTCLRCVSDERSKQQLQQQENQRLSQSLSRVRSWLSHYNYHGHINAHSLSDLQSSLRSAFASLESSHSTQIREARQELTSKSENANQVNLIYKLCINGNQSLHEIKKHVDLLKNNSDKSKMLDVLKENTKNRDPRVVVFGPMNHGKSSLLNALIEKKEYFKVADARQTIEVDEVTHNGIIYRDVPGWDAADKTDNTTALHGLDDCDVWLYNHDINVGELNVIDLSCLQEFVQKIANQKVCSLGLIFCLSKIDKKDGIEINEVKNKIITQLENIKIGSGKGMSFFSMIEISAKNFILSLDLSASAKKREHFFANSGINQLRESIDSAIRNKHIIDNQKQIKKIMNMCEGIMSTQDISINTDQQKISDMQRKLEEMQSSYHVLTNSI